MTAQPTRHAAASCPAVLDNGWHVHAGSSLAHRLLLVAAVSPLPWVAWLLLVHPLSYRWSVAALPLLAALPLRYVRRVCSALLQGSPGLREWCDEAHRTLWLVQ